WAATLASGDYGPRRWRARAPRWWRWERRGERPAAGHGLVAGLRRQVVPAVAGAAAAHGPAAPAHRAVARRAADGRPPAGDGLPGRHLPARLRAAAAGDERLRQGGPRGAGAGPAARRWLRGR